MDSGYISNRRGARRRGSTFLVIAFCVVTGLSIAAYQKYHEPPVFEAPVTVQMAGSARGQTADTQRLELLSRPAWLEQHVVDMGVPDAWGMSAGQTANVLAESASIRRAAAGDKAPVWEISYRTADPHEAADLSNELVRRWAKAVEIQPDFARARVYLQMNVDAVRPSFDETDPQLTEDETLLRAVDVLGLDEVWGITRAQAAEKILPNLTVRPHPGTDLLDIEYVGENQAPSLTAQIADAVAEAFVARRTEAERQTSAVALETLTNRLQEQTSTMEEARARLEELVGGARGGEGQHADARKSYENEKARLEEMQSTFATRQVDLTMPKVPVTIHGKAEVAGSAPQPAANIVSWSTPNTQPLPKAWAPALLWGGVIGLLGGVVLGVARSRIQ